MGLLACIRGFVRRRIARAGASVLACATFVAFALGAPATAQASQDVPVGTMVAWGGTSVPAGWLPADGAAVSRSAWPELFAAIGTTYGAGDGTTTFNVPDLRQRFPMGQSTAGTGSTLGSTGGSIDHTHALASHFHTIATGGDHTHAFASHAHTLPGHRHTGFSGVTMDAAGAHQHTLDGNRFFVVVNGSNTLYNLAGGSIPIDQRASTTTAGNHSHAYNGTVGPASGENGNAAFASTSATPAVSAFTGSHAHGAQTGLAAPTTSSNNPAFLAVDYLVKASPAAAAPCGAIWGSARSAPGAGALAADGAAVARGTEASLFGCLGTTFGAGDGATTFNLPDLRGRFPLGKATAGTGSVLGGSGGSLDHTHDASHAHSVSVDGSHSTMMPAHAHGTPGHNHSANLDTTADGAHAHNSNQGGAMVGEESGGNFRGTGGTRDYDTPTSTTVDGGHDHTVSGDVGNVGSGRNGNGAEPTSASAAVTSAAAGAHDHGGATQASLATTDAGNPAFRAINYEVQSNPASAPAVGTIAPYAATGTPPVGWLVADGSAVSRTTYASLFAEIGTTYGAGDGTTTFNLPDLRGRLPLGKATAGTGSVLGGSGGTLDHGHVSTHGHGLTAAPDHDHGGMGHTHGMLGHFHSFSRTFGTAGGHQHGFMGGGNFWGEALVGGSRPVVDVAQGGSRNAAHVSFTDQAWGSHRHSGITGTVGQAADPDGDATLTSGSTDPDVVDSGGHAHVVGTDATSTSSANAPFLALRFIIRTGPVVTDNQVGDDTWRNANVATYDVDFEDVAGLSRAETNVWSANGRTGTEVQAWTQATLLAGTSHTADWSLAPSTWTALAEGVNFVSVRAWTTGDQLSSTLIDAFYVRKDTQAAAPASVADGTGADATYAASTTTLDANWPASGGETGRSGVLRYEYCIATGGSCSGTVARSWTSAGSATSLAATGLALSDGATYLVSVRMVDNAGNTSAPTSSNGVTIDVSAPVATPSGPSDGAGAPTWPALTATYADPAPGSPGQLAFQLCSDAACTSVVQSGTSASGLAPGASGSWTPTAPDGAYWWRVRATDGVGQTGAWSTSRAVTVGVAAMNVTVDAMPPTTAVPGQQAMVTTTVHVTTDSAGGYQLLASDTSNTSSLAGPSAIADWTGSVAAPTAWGSASLGYAGLTIRDATGGRLAKWGAGTGWPEGDVANNRYAGLTSTGQLVHQRAAPATDDVLATFRFAPTLAQQPGTYSATITFTAVAVP